jgi:hypothetical protein
MNQDGVSIYHSDPLGEKIEAIRLTMKNEIPSYINSQALGLKENDRIEESIHNQIYIHKRNDRSFPRCIWCYSNNSQSD